MEKSFSITRDDLRYLVNETVRRVLLIRESMEEGGAARHMSHPFDVNELTFGEFKELVVKLFRTGIEHASEKLDGMNIFATVTPGGEPRFARNEKQLKGDDTGMNIRDMEERWGGEGKDESILVAYKNAYYLFSEAVKRLPDPVAFFNGNGYKIFANCEVIDPRHPNVIHYSNVAFSVHGLVAFTNDGTAQPVELPEEEKAWRMNLLKKVLPMDTEYGKVQTTPEVVIKIRENGEKMIERFIAEIDHLEEISGTDDETTVAGYKKAMIRNYLDFKGFQVILNQPFTDLFINRWAYSDKEKKEKPQEVQDMPGIVQLKKQIKMSGIENADEIITAITVFEKEHLPQVFRDMMMLLENFFYHLGNEVIRGVQGLANEGNEDSTVQNLISQLEATQDMLAKGGDTELQTEMTYWLSRLAQMDNEYNATEGIVFNFKGRTLKLTGSFAALNRAINLRLQYQNKLRRQQKNQA